MDWITDPHGWMALLTLTALEIVLGVDHAIFISIFVSNLPARLQDRARTVGLGVAMIGRIILLLSRTWAMRLTSPLSSVADLEISGAT